MNLDGWIEHEFAGYGRAIRAQHEAPYPDEPFMSMEDAKELTRRAVAEFGAVPTTCEICSAWAARSQAQIDNRLRNMSAAPDVAPYACPRCGSSVWATTTAFITPTTRLRRLYEWFWSRWFLQVFGTGFTIFVFATIIIAFAGAPR